MSVRYTVAANQHGYETNGKSLRFCVIDTQPDRKPVFNSRDQMWELWQPVGNADLPRLRQIAFCVHPEDAENLADAMNNVPALEILLEEAKNKGTYK